MSDQTHFGFESVSTDEKARKVAGVFDSVAGKYDLMNDLMSCGLHRLWKAYAVERSGLRAGGRVLDIAGGSGDLARAYAKRVGSGGQVWLSDINRAMLAVGRDRATDAGMLLPVLNACRAAAVPSVISIVSVAFGLHNMTRQERTLAVRRVLRPAAALVLEFSGRQPLSGIYDGTRSTYCLAGKIVDDGGELSVPCRIDRMHPGREN